MTSNAPDPDAEAEVAAEVDGIQVEWTTTVHQYVLDMEEAATRREAESEALAQANEAIAAAAYDALTLEEKEALEAEYQAEGYREHQAWLEEQAEPELFDRLEAEISEPEIGD
jgi:hypothetical protein